MSKKIITKHLKRKYSQVKEHFSTMPSQHSAELLQCWDNCIAEGALSNNLYWKKECYESCTDDNDKYSRTWFNT